MLTRLKKADAVIVGGGLTGLLLGASWSQITESRPGVCFPPELAKCHGPHSSGFDILRKHASGEFYTQLNYKLAEKQFSKSRAKENSR